MTRPPRPPGAPLLSPFLLWRVVLVSVLFAAIVLSICFGMLERGADLPTARTMVVNMLIVAEIAYLFNVRFLHMRSLTLRGAMGTPAVLLAIAVVVLAQLAFTYLTVMTRLFDSKPPSLTHGPAIIGVAAAGLLDRDSGV